MGCRKKLHQKPRKEHQRPTAHHLVIGAAAPEYPVVSATGIFINRKDGYLNKLLAKGRSVIYDASVDRTWQAFKQRLEQEGYITFLISFDLSPEFVKKLGTSASSLIDSDAMEVYFTQHKKFLDAHGSTVDVHLTDKNFADRFDICIKAIDDMLA